MPTVQQLTDRLEDLYSELEALRYYRRKKLITAPGFATQKAKIQRSIDVAEDRLYDARLKETKKKAEQAKRKAQADAMRAVLLAEEKARYKARLHQQFLTQDEIRIELQPTEEGVVPMSPLSDSELLDFIVRQPGRWVIQVGDVHYTLNDATKMRLQELVTAGLVEEEFGIDSDGVLLTAIYNASFLIARRVTEQQANQYGFIDEGAFFPYYHNTHFDLKRFQIFKNGSEASYEENCLLYAFAVAGVKQETLDLLKTKVKNRNVPVKVMEDIARTLKMKIVVKTKDVNHRDRRVYGKEFADVMPLGLLEGHYFFIEKTNITSYCLDHYEELKDVKDCNLIYNSLGMKNKDRCIDSYDVVKHLLANKQLLTPISMDDALIATTQFYDQANQTITSLEYEEDKCVRPVIQKKKEGKKEKKKFVNVFFDFETDPNNEHIPYLCRTFDGSVHREFIGENCAYDMLCSMTANTRFIAHNATYDYRFIIKYLHNISEISRGTRLISCSAEFGDKLIQVKDSFHLISHPLRKFPEMFGIKDTVKEVMPYKLYTQDNIKKRFVSIEEALEHINEKDRQQFLDNLERWNLIKGDTYDIITYSSLYCKIDCEILYKGYTTFREWVLKALTIDIDDVLTTASLADLYFRNEGCYDDVNELSGIPQLFIQGCVVGGRTMCAENKMIKVEAKINDFDAVSLYPSAMYRMDGFLKGSPKVLKDLPKATCGLSYEFLQKQDGYFVDIVIKSVGIPRKFPLMSYMNEGVRNFTNDMVGRTMRVDKYTLEDLIQFHNITFDVVRGYYFNNGFNTKIKDTILFCFLERLKLKKEGNPAQEIYKLLMNSGYGKTIMKPVDSQVKFFEDKKAYETYHRRHYNWITSHIYFGNKVRCDMVKPLNEHYNRAHIGTCILSMSKRIMNEVMCLADDQKIDIYYQDTDSMHLQDKHISVLSSKFKEIYGRDLIGKNFGQFHSDFDIKGASNVFSRRAIFLGKKAYIDELVGQDQDGKEVVDYHIRLKGIPNSVILHHCKTHGFNNPFELYETLSRGDTVAFDLTNDGTKPNFKFNKNYTINTLSIFTRAVKYGA
jgi:DNA polymerase type B, organellar and viral